MKHVVPFTFLVLFACSEIPEQAYYTRGQPESLLEVTQTEAIFTLNKKTVVSDISKWIKNASPSEALLHCQKKNKICNRVEALLKKKGISTARNTSSTNEVTFFYEQISVRKCENRYIDNTVNPYNLNHPTFGCTIASNSAQMVANKQQFINPNLTDKTDARKPVQVTDFYNTATKPETDSTPLTTSKTLVSGSGGGGR